MSLRNITTGPSPFFSTAATPVPPMPVCTW